MRSLRLLASIVFVAALAGCAAEGAGTGNFELKPQKVGWYVGDEARFTLSITSTLLRSSPTFTLDRHFALEEVKFDESGLTFGGDFETRDPDAVTLRLERANSTADEWTLDADHPSVDVVVLLPESLRDSTYTMSVKLFDVGWVESEAFRVDHR